jgi:hypothetical protein
LFGVVGGVEDETKGYFEYGGDLSVVRNQEQVGYDDA